MKLDEDGKSVGVGNVDGRRSSTVVDVEIVIVDSV
jgi:hypothetical protein